MTIVLWRNSVEDFRFGDEDDDYRDDSYGDDDGYDDRYESLDDYIDKL